MQKRPADLAASRQTQTKLIMVLEHDEQSGTHCVPLIRQETAFQAILATNLSEVRTILQHLKCDLLLLTDDAFPEEDLEWLDLLPEDSEPPEWLSLTCLCWASNYRDKRDVRSIIKAMKLLLAVGDGV